MCIGLSIQIDDNFFTSGNRVLGGGKLHQFMGGGRINPSSMRDDKLAPPFL